MNADVSRRWASLPAPRMPVLPRGWYQRAACQDMDVELSHPDGRGHAAAAGYAEMRRACAVCPVALECLLEVLAAEATLVRAGMAAGLTHDDRKDLDVSARRLRELANWRATPLPGGRLPEPLHGQVLGRLAALAAQKQRLAELWERRAALKAGRLTAAVGA